MKTSTRFLHLPTGTWRGGPTGVRWNVAIVCNLVTSMTLIDLKHQVPTEIQRLYTKEKHEGLWQQVTVLASWLSRSLQKSIEVLSGTFENRSDAWKQAVLSQHQRIRQSPAARSGSSTPGPDPTFGLPTNPTELHAYAEKLLQSGEAVPVATASSSLSPAPADTGSLPGSSTRQQVPQLRPRVQTQSAEPDGSRENFNLSDISSSSNQAHPEDKAWSPGPVLSNRGKEVPLTNANDCLHVKPY